MSTLPWLDQLLSQTDITDICINGETSLYIDQGRGMSEIKHPGTETEALMKWCFSALSLVGKTWDARFPFADASLPSGHRLHVAFPPLASPGPLISLRRLGARKSSLEAGRERWSSQARIFQFLVEQVQASKSLIIAGATGSGKTTLASDLLAHVNGGERILAIEDTPELAPSHPHFISLTGRPPSADGVGEVTLRDLMRQALRMRPDRIILGECRGPEVLELLQALNTGHRGALATLHAHSPRDALRRIELLCLLASQGTVPLSVVRDLLSVGVDYLVQVERSPEGRKVVSVQQVAGREGDLILLRSLPLMEQNG